ncbi:MAG: hypothetical protein OXI43_09530 [Candidatus Poribacteria bacterium]|nr:hypothetical protein [Candidatus Poribacteria bacterium]
MKDTQLSLIFTITIVVLAFLAITGCDEGMQMTKPIMDMDPAEKPTTNGETKQPDPGGQDPKKPETPTLIIYTVVPADDGSITISGTSTNLPKGTTATITLADTITVTATTDKSGAWSATVPATKAAQITGVVAVTAVAGKATDKSSFDLTPPPEPTVTIESITTKDDGSITVSGTSTELPAGETVTITLGDTVTITATTNSKGAWSVTVPATEAAGLAAGSVAVRATAKGIAEDESSFEHTPQQQPGHGIVPATEAERIQRDIITDVAGEGFFSESGYNNIIAKYGSLFDIGTDIGRATFRRFVEYEYKTGLLAISGNLGDTATLKQYYAEAYGHSHSFAVSLVHDVYLKEKPEDKKLLNIRWQVHGIGMEYLLLQIANPDASEEELIELLRESIRAGNVSIAA